MLSTREQLRQNGHGHPQGAAQFLVPMAGLQIHQQGATGIAAIRGMAIASGELPEQPAVDSAKAEFTGKRRRHSVVLLQQPKQLAGREIGIRQQAGALTNQRLKTLFFPCGTELPFYPRRQKPLHGYA